MATTFLSEKQRQALEQFPEYIDEEMLFQYFTLSTADIDLIPTTSPAYSRLGFALSLCGLRFLGFIPGEEIQTIRKKQHLSQAAFAKCLNISPAMIKSLELGQRKAQGAILQLLNIVERHGISILI